MVLQQDSLGKIFEPTCLPCGRTVSNRLVKVSMYEHGASLFGGPPNSYHYQLYSRWSKGKWGMIFTGNVQVDPRHLSLGRDLILPQALSANSLRPFKRFAEAIHGVIEGGGRLSDTQPLAIMQLSHGGRQSTSILGGRLPWNPPLAPSPIPLGAKHSKADGIISRFIYKLLFHTPKEMTTRDIDHVVDLFVHGAEVAAASDFDGIELHASHGYLLAQFISQQHNQRQDEYSAITSPLRLVHRIVKRIRQVAPDDFVVGVKLNAADYIDSDSAEQSITESKRDQEGRALQHVIEIASWGMVDFIEVSGGDYENPGFITTKSSRQAFFSQFSRSAMKVLSTRCANSQTPPLILLTGGFRNQSTLNSALANDHAHLLGVGRLSVLNPDLPLQLEIGDGQFMAPPNRKISKLDRFMVSGGLMTRIQLPKLIGAGMEMAWYVVQMRSLASEQQGNDMGGIEGLLRMWLWIAPRNTETSKGVLPPLTMALMIVLILFVSRSLFA